MDDFSVLIGGKAGSGIDRSGLIIASILNRIGYCIYVYRDYPSIIRGAHTYSIVRACHKKIAAHREKIDFLLALDQDTYDFHRKYLKKDSIILYDIDSVKINQTDGNMIGISSGEILKEEKAPEIMRNTCLIGAFGRVIDIDIRHLKDILAKEIKKRLDLNIKVMERGFNAAKKLTKIENFEDESLPLVSGSQAVGLGLIRGGLNAYISYPMTPTSPILHFLAEVADDFGVKVIHPESEIGVILMALGFSYMGERSAVGTSGGGFCLMTEGLSLSGMAEMPVVIIVGQRPGPSTGLPTYTSQTELNFVLSAGQGEFLRFIAAPGDAEESYYWADFAQKISWKYQIPAFLLTDKTLGEGIFNLDIDSIGDIKGLTIVSWDKKQPYKRYQNTKNGISPLVFVPERDAVIKANSYEHDESGITTEDAKTTLLLQHTRFRTEIYLSEELEGYNLVKVYGKKDANIALLCWGSNKGVSIEVAEMLGLKVIQPLVLHPFSGKQFAEALKGVKKLIAVENNATGQLADLVKKYGFDVNEKILKYDGRPFSLEELEERVKKLM